VDEKAEMGRSSPNPWLVRLAIHGRSLSLMLMHQRTAYQLRLAIHGRSLSFMLMHQRTAYQLRLAIHGRSFSLMLLHQRTAYEVTEPTYFSTQLYVLGEWYSIINLRCIKYLWQYGLFTQTN